MAKKASIYSAIVPIVVAGLFAGGYLLLKAAGGVGTSAARTVR
jgi:hypothetical protein